MSDIRDIKFGVCDTCLKPLCQCSKPMTDHAQRAHARRAITCLYLQLPESIAKDVEEIIEAAFAEDDQRITQAHAQGRREGLEEAAKIAETHGVHPALNVWDGGPEWYKHGKAIASAIRDTAKEAGHE